MPTINAMRLCTRYNTNVNTAFSGKILNLDNYLYILIDPNVTFYHSQTTSALFRSKITHHYYRL